MAISSKEEWEALQQNLPENQRSSYDQYLAAIGMTPTDAAQRVAAQEGKSQYVADTTVDRSGTPTYVLPAGTTQLTKEQLAAVVGETPIRNIIDQATGKLVLFNPSTGEVFKGGVEDQEGWYNFLNPRAKGTAGRLYGGVASGTFIKNANGTWTIGQGGTETTSGSGFARLLARLGFDATSVKAGESVTIGDDGLVEYKGKKFQPLTGTDANTLISKIESAIKSGTLLSGGAVTPGTITNFGAGSSTTSVTNPYAPGSEAAEAWEGRKSAYDLLYQQFNQYGLGALVAPLQSLIQTGVSPSEFTIRLRDTDAYKKRFGANQARIQKGLRALSEAEYISLEDQYQDVMRRYGLPESYYSRGDMGRQEGFEKLISNDVSNVELEDRIQTAYNRVINANPEVGIALRSFYPDITNGDILAYALDPQQALDKIKRKITAAEIGGAAVQAGLTTNESDAAYLARYGITKEQAQQGYRTISGYLPRAEQLSSIYGKQVEGGPYTQASAEREVFNVPGAAEEERKRLKIAGLEQAAFGGSSGLTGGALGRERAGQF